MSEESNSNNGGKGKAVVSWTGGKDGYITFYKAICEGRDARYLLSFWNMNRQGTHEVNPDLLRAQAEAMGIALIRTGFTSYEEEFKRVFLDLNEKESEKGTKIDSAIFGHIETHNDLVERICDALGIELVMPIWNQNSEQIINEVVAAGFEVILVSVKADLFGRGMAGQKDRRELPRRPAGSRRLHRPLRRERRVSHLRPRRPDVQKEAEDRQKRDDVEGGALVSGRQGVCGRGERGFVINNIGSSLFFLNSQMTDRARPLP